MNLHIKHLSQGRKRKQKVLGSRDQHKVVGRVQREEIRNGRKMFAGEGGALHWQRMAKWTG